MTVGQDTTKPRKRGDAKIDVLCWLQQDTSLRAWQALIGPGYAAEDSLPVTDASLARSRLGPE